MFENADWNLIFIGLGALFALLLVIVETYQAYQKYVVPKKEKEKENKKKELEKELSNVRQFTTLIQRSLEERVKDNSFPKSSNVNLFYTPSGLKEKGKKYDEKYDLCVDLKKACKTVITLHLQDLTKKHLFTTSKGYDLVTQLNAEDLVQRYLNNEKVTKRWIEETYPSFYSSIMENLKEREKTLDQFFLELNGTFQKDPVLERFRKEKAHLIELGNEISNDLTHKEEELKKELEKVT